MSITEIEYVTVTETCKELIWLKNFLKELGKEQMTLTLHSDIQSIINFANNPVYHDRTNHIDVWYHFVCILLNDGALSLVKIQTSQNLMDKMTKMIAIEKLKTCSASVVF